MQEKEESDGLELIHDDGHSFNNDTGRQPAHTHASLSSDEHESDEDSMAGGNDSNTDTDTDSQHSFPRETLYRYYTNSVHIRRRPVSLSDSSEYDDETEQSLRHRRHHPRRRSSDSDQPQQQQQPRRTRIRRRRRLPNPFHECFHFYHERCPLLCNERTNMLLLICFLIWFVVQLHDALQPSSLPSLYEDPMQAAIRNHSAAIRDRLRRGEISEREFVALREEERRKRLKSHHSFWGSAAEQLLERWIQPVSHTTKRRKGNMERLPPGCQPTEWQRLSFPNCNEVHELDLREVLGLGGNRSSNISTSKMMTTFDHVGSYVGEGMWRTVWKVQGRGNVTLALKTMKGEHEWDHRNLERHRRDALTMERLTSSPYITSIYGHCGNTVLTEFLSLGLDKLVYSTTDDDTKTFHATSTTATRQTPLGRLHLALSVARGIAAIHNFPGGPIIHADIQAKQFLVDSWGTVKLNDFNRCRFMANSTATGTPCPLRIPSAPGSSRSPEEYNFNELTERIDVYSTAHVLYGILTGERVWETLWGTQVKKLVKEGNKPPIDKQYLTLGTSDAALANLIDLAYEWDPKDRIPASKLVGELERLVAVEEAKKQIGNHFRV